MENRDYAVEYGIRCRQIRQAKGLSQQALADLMHVTPQAVSKWEKEGVKDVNTVQKLTDVLGQDITADQIDQEGHLGEIGKEILQILVNHGGYLDFDLLVDDMYGMSVERVSNEIFKLERVGLAVREQFKDYVDDDRDGLIITAKGLIAYKNCGLAVDADLINNTATLEMKLEPGMTSIQDIIDGDEVSKILWKMEDAEGYMADYVYYLKRAHQSTFTMNEDESLKLFPSYVVFGETCFIDVINRMILGVSDYDIYDIMEENEIIDDLGEDVYFGFDPGEQLYKSMSMDYCSAFSQRFLSSVYPPLESFDSAILRGNTYFSKDDVDAQKAKENMEKKGKGIDASEFVRRVESFFADLPDEIKNNCTKWFSKEKVEEFVENNFDLWPSEPGGTMEDYYGSYYGGLIKKIWKLKPETLDYFYCFPDEWEENGLAQKLRDKFRIPNDEEDVEEPISEGTSDK